MNLQGFQYSDVPLNSAFYQMSNKLINKIVINFSCGSSLILIFHLRG